ncbi:MAG: hypothetical protein R3B51_13010 [Thermodesulfobacteriota bacterium]
MGDTPAAYRSKWIDQSQSVNIFVDTVSASAYPRHTLGAWKSGLKTTITSPFAQASKSKSTIEAGGIYPPGPRCRRNTERVQSRGGMRIMSVTSNETRNGNHGKVGRCRRRTPETTSA